MWNSHFKKIPILTILMFIQPALNQGSFALAKKRPMRAFSFITEAGKASQGECDGEREIPRKMKRLKEFSRANSYVGSELQNPELKGKGEEEMLKHFFKVKGPCNSALAKTPSSVNESIKNNKIELPPEDSTDSDNDAEKSEAPDSE